MRSNEKTILRTKGNRWCELQVSLENGRLSICGSEGRITSRARGSREARQYWSDFLKENPAELGRMVEQFGATSRRNAIDIIQRVDGEFHGLDVHKAKEDNLYLTESCGQIRETLEKWFPEAVPYMQYHLNDMHAECEHQEARGETYATHPSAICPDCGYSLGSKWLKRDLPANVIAWFNHLGQEVTA